MKVTFETNEILPKLSDVASVINVKNSMPILSDICVMVSNENIILTASDGENWVTERAEVLASDMEATFCVAAKDIINCLRALSDENVTMTIDDESNLLTLDYVSGKISLPFESADEFPKPNINIDGATDVIVRSGVMRNLIKLASASVENSVVRPIMSGVHFRFSDGKMTVNGASHKRVVRIVEDASISDGAEFTEFTLPPKASLVIMSVLEGIDEDVKVRFTDKSASVSNKNFKISARLLEGRYPDCDSVIPDNNTVSIEVDKERMVQALKHVLSIENMSRLITVNLKDDSLNISAEELNFGRNSEECVNCKNYNQSELSISFNGESLSETLRSIDSKTVMIDMSTPTRPAVIYAKDEGMSDKYITILMPMVAQKVVEK